MDIYREKRPPPTSRHEFAPLSFTRNHRTRHPEGLPGGHEDQIPLKVEGEAPAPHRYTDDGVERIFVFCSRTFVNESKLKVTSLSSSLIQPNRPTRYKTLTLKPIPFQYNHFIGEVDPMVASILRQLPREHRRSRAAGTYVSHFPHAKQHTECQ